MVWDLNAHYPRGHYFSYAILAKIQTQGFNSKEFKPKDSRAKELKPAKGKTPILSYSKFTELGKTSRIDKIREYFKKKQDQKNNTLATRDNANAIEGEKKRNNQGNKRCYNCQKKSHFLKNCLEPPKN